MLWLCVCVTLLQCAGSFVTGYKLQRKRFRYKPQDVEPHPDDSDSAPEDGNYNEDWQDVAEIPSQLAREFGKLDVVQDFKRSSSAAAERPKLAEVSWVFLMIATAASS